MMAFNCFAYYTCYIINSSYINNYIRIFKRELRREHFGLEGLFKGKNLMRVSTDMLIEFELIYVLIVGDDGKIKGFD
jgi:hypothetical protein